MNIIDQVKQTLVEEIAASINKAGLADEIPDIKIEVPKDTKMEIMLLILRWYWLRLQSVILVKLLKR